LPGKNHFEVWLEANPGGTLEQYNLFYKGETGDRGEKGETGEKGDKGEIGNTGLSGPPGYTPQKGLDYNDGLPGPVGSAGPAGPPGYPFDIIKILDNIEGLPPGAPTVNSDAYGVRINGAVHVYYYMKGVPGWQDLGSLGNISVISEGTAGFYNPATNVITVFGDQPLSIKQAFDALAVYVLQNNSSNLNTRFVLTNDLTNTVQLC